MEHILFINKCTSQYQGISVFIVFIFLFWVYNVFRFLNICCSHNTLREQKFNYFLLFLDAETRALEGKLLFFLFGYFGKLCLISAMCLRT